MPCDAGKTAYAGPAERRLAATISSADTLSISQASSGWREAASTLRQAKMQLTRQADALREQGTLSGAGPEAARGYEVLAQQVQQRIETIETAAGALGEAIVAIDAVKNTNLPPVIQASDMQGALRAEDLTADEMRKIRQQAHASRMNLREKESQIALDKLDGELEKVAKVFREITGERSVGGPTPTSSSRTPGPGIPNAPRVPSGSGDDDRGGFVIEPVRVPPQVIGTPPTIEPPVIIDPVDPVDPRTTLPIDPGDTDNGSPPPNQPVRPVSPSSPGPGGPGISAAVTGVGAGVVSTGAALAATRGGVPLRGLTPGTPAQLGRTSTTAGSGTLGRPGMTPGQSATGRPGAAGGRASGVGRGAMAPGQGGTRGGAGRRGVAAAGTGGARRGKRDGADEREGLAYSDDESWLGDEEASDGVIG